MGDFVSASRNVSSIMSMERRSINTIQISYLTLCFSLGPAFFVGEQPELIAT